MKRGTKVALILAACLLVAGLSLTAVFFSIWDIRNFSWRSEELSTKTYTVEDTFENVRIETVDADIVLLAPSAEGICQVTCMESEHIRYDISVKNGTLEIGMKDSRRWWHGVSFDFSSEKQEVQLTLALPETVYNNLKLATVSGDITLPADYSFEDVSLQSVSGSIYHSGIVTADLEAKTVSGRIRLSESDAGYLCLENVSGDITGTLLSGKIFSAKTTSGDISLPPSLSDGGKCSVETVSGDIRLEVK